MNEPKLRFKADDGSQFPDWEEKKFHEVIKLYRGSSPRPIVEYIVDDNQGSNWIKISDIPQNGNVIITVKEHISKEGAKKSRAVYKGEIILSNSMSFGKPCILGIDGFIHDGWFVVREYEKYLNKWYLCQLLSSDIMYKQYRRLAAGGVVLNISSEIVNSTKISVPSLPEQQKIADFLSTIDTVIAKQKETVSAWEERKKGVMQKLFSQEVRFKADDGSDFPEWEEKKLGEVSDIMTGNTPSTKQEDYYGGCYLWVTPTDITDSREVSVTAKKLTELGYTVARHIPANSVLVTCIASIGKNAIIRENGSCNQQINSITPYNDYSVEFVYYLICQNERLLHANAGAGGMEILNKDSFSKIKMYFPCLAEQQKIADCLSSLDEVIEKQKATLAAWEELKKGLLQQMFV